LINEKYKNYIQWVDGSPLDRKLYQIGPSKIKVGELRGQEWKIK